MVFGSCRPCMRASERTGFAGRGGHARGRGRSSRWARRRWSSAKWRWAWSSWSAPACWCRTFVHLRSLSPGFDPSKSITATISLQDARYRGLRESESTLQPIRSNASAPFQVFSPPASRSGSRIRGSSTSDSVRSTEDRPYRARDHQRQLHHAGVSAGASSPAPRGARFHGRRPRWRRRRCNRQRGVRDAGTTRGKAYGAAHQCRRDAHDRRDCCDRSCDLVRIRRFQRSPRVAAHRLHSGRAGGRRLFQTRAHVVLPRVGRAEPRLGRAGRRGHSSSVQGVDPLLPIAKMESMSECRPNRSRINGS